MRYFFALLFFFASFFANAQQLLNLSFEQKSAEQTAELVRPWGWEWGTWDAKSSEDYSFTMDSSEVFSGKYSFRLTGSGSPEAEAQYASFYLEPMELAGQAITLTARMKCKDLNGQAFLSVLHSPEDSASATSHSIFGTADWTEFTVAVRFPDEEDLPAEIRLNISGSGTVWFDDLHLSVNGVEHTSLEVAPPFAEEEMSWLAGHFTPLTTADANGNIKKYEAPEDLAAFKHLVGDARLIALGESTHGTSEFFRLKHRLLEYSVHELNVRAFALEGNMLTVEKINNYVLHGTGTAKTSMHGIFGVWYTQEVLDMVEWVRSYNQKHRNDPVRFVGYDVQEVIPAIDSLRGFLQHRKPALLAQYDPFLSELHANGGFGVAAGASKQTRQRWFEQSAQLLKRMEGELKKEMAEARMTEPENGDAINLNDIVWGFQYANLIKQFAENTLKGHFSFYRDEAMAENISWWLEQMKPGQRMLIWAHDYHISRGDHPDNDMNIYGGLSMGRHLSEHYGKDYIAFGMTTYQGSYTGQVSYSNFSSVQCPLYPSPVGTLEHALHEASLNSNGDVGVLLNLSEARDQSWFMEHRRMRFANHVSIDYGYWTEYAIPWQFDGVLFIDKTTGSTAIE